MAENAKHQTQRPRILSTKIYYLLLQCGSMRAQAPALSLSFSIIFVNFSTQTDAEQSCREAIKPISYTTAKMHQRFCVCVLYLSIRQMSMSVTNKTPIFGTFPTHVARNRFSWSQYSIRKKLLVAFHRNSLCDTAKDVTHGA